MDAAATERDWFNLQDAAGLVPHVSTTHDRMLSRVDFGSARHPAIRDT
jgi:hypothetical protein